MKIIDFQHFLKAKPFWFLMIFLGFFLEGTALYYQYVLQEWPCVLCIHFRLLVALLIILSFIGLVFRTNKAALWTVSILLLLVFIAMIDRSYQLLGTERGFFIGSCTMDLGFPAWLAIDKWIPWLFGVKTTCGYTPVIAFGITMAEALMVLSVGLTLFQLFMLFALTRRQTGLSFRNW